MAEIIITDREFGVAKNTLYEYIIEKFIDAGWTDIATQPTTEFNVLYSPGSKDDQNLYLQLRPWWNSGTDAAKNLDGSGNFIGFRLVQGYTPSPSGPGAAGTFANNPAWQTARVFNAAVAATQTGIEVSCFVDLDRCIFVFRQPVGLGIQATNIFGFGIPDDFYGLQREGTRDMIAFGTDIMNDAATPVSIGALKLLGANWPYGYTDSTTSPAYTVTIPYVNPNPNFAQKFVLSDNYYSIGTAASQGIVGKLWGVKTIYNVNPAIVDKDIIIDGEKKYQVIVNGTVTTNGFGTVTTAMRIE
jgi:hypothetical protein